MPNEPKPAAQKRTRTDRHENDQGDHEGSAHRPEEFDVMNPEKQVPADEKTSDTKEVGKDR